MAWCWWEEHVRTLPFVLDLQHTAYGKDDKRISSQGDGFDLLLPWKAQTPMQLIWQSTSSRTRPKLKPWRGCGYCHCTWRFALYPTAAFPLQAVLCIFLWSDWAWQSWFEFESLCGLCVFLCARWRRVLWESPVALKVAWWTNLSKRWTLKEE